MELKSFPSFLRSIIAKVEGTFHTKQAEAIGRTRLESMKRFLHRIEQELNHEA